MECAMTKWEWFKEILATILFFALMAEVYFVLWVFSPAGGQ